MGISQKSGLDIILSLFVQHNSLRQEKNYLLDFLVVVFSGLNRYFPRPRGPSFHADRGVILKKSWRRHEIFRNGRGI